MAHDAMNLWQGDHFSPMADDSDNDVTLVRCVLSSSGVVGDEADGHGVVWIDPEDVYDDEGHTVSGVFSFIDPAFLAAVCEGPAIFGVETQRKLQKIVDQMREVDFNFPGGRGACERHVLEAKLRRRLDDAMRFESDW